MLNLDEINSTIEELENSSTTFDTCNKLASLYIVRQHLQKDNEPVVQTVVHKVETELQDILPHYRKYCDIKRQYQLKEIPESAVYRAMNIVCTEIKEFLHILYSSTDTQEERTIIRQMLQDINRAL